MPISSDLPPVWCDGVRRKQRLWLCDTEYHMVPKATVLLLNEEGVLKGGGQTNDAKHREFLRPPPFNILLALFFLIVRVK